MWYLIGNTQNLVPNPDFSILSQCPDSRGQLELAEPWFSPNGRTTDLAHLCSDSAAYNIPFNRWGEQAPLTGDGYAGIRTWLDTVIFADRLYREYLAVQLGDTLTPGESYYLAFSVSPGEQSRYITDDVALAFSRQIPSQNFLLPYTPVLSNPDGNLLSDFNRWYTIDGQYVASGGESYLIIGNFKNEAQTTRTISPHTDSAFESTYLFVDDVIVRPCTGLVGPNFLALDDTAVCAGDPVPLQLKSDVLYDSLWADKRRLNPPAFFSDSGGIEIFLAYKGCETKDTIHIRYMDQPVLELPADTSICLGDSLWVQPDIGTALFQWQDNWPTLNRSLSSAGKYTLELIQGVCKASDAISLSIIHQPEGTSAETLLCIGTPWVIEAGASGFSYLWSDGLTDSGRMLTASGAYIRTAENACGVVVDTFLLRTEDCACSLTAENVFTPNRDGINDTWELTIPPGAQMQRVEIFDRWGRLVRRLEEGTREWDGLNQREKEAVTGVYFWSVTMLCEEGGKSSVKLFNGAVTLL
ncbi:MAG: gliding motility-associated C-terminal domain-containing protein [Bacteroidota bacterium]